MYGFVCCALPGNPWWPHILVAQVVGCVGYRGQVLCLTCLTWSVSLAGTISLYLDWQHNCDVSQSLIKYQQTFFSGLPDSLKRSFSCINRSRQAERGAPARFLCVLFHSVNLRALRGVWWSCAAVSCLFSQRESMPLFFFYSHLPS